MTDHPATTPATENTDRPDPETGFSPAAETVQRYPTGGQRDQATWTPDDFADLRGQGDHPVDGWASVDRKAATGLLRDRGQEIRDAEEVQQGLLRNIRRWLGHRPPLIAPVPRTALAAGTAAIVETRSRLAPRGETLRNRPAGDIAATVLNAGSPYIQLDLLRRVAGEHSLPLGAWVISQVVAVTAGLLAGLGYAVVAGVNWLTVLLGCVLVIHAIGVQQTFAEGRRQRRAARSLMKRPATGQPAEDQAEATVDILSSGGTR